MIVLLLFFGVDGGEKNDDTGNDNDVKDGDEGGGMVVLDVCCFLYLCLLNVVEQYF